MPLIQPQRQVAFVIAKFDIVLWLVLFDERVFENGRFLLTGGNDRLDIDDRTNEKGQLSA